MIQIQHIKNRIYILVERDNCVVSLDVRQRSVMLASLALVEQTCEVCGDAGPVELKVKEFFLSLVERIRQRLCAMPADESCQACFFRDAEVYCIGARV